MVGVHLFSKFYAYVKFEETNEKCVEIWFGIEILENKGIGLK